MRKTMRNRKRLLCLLTVSVLLLLVCCIGRIAAYFSDRTELAQNIFTPGVVSCEIREDFNGTVKSNVRIENTGNTDAFIRACVVVNWANENGNIYGVSSPKVGVDYNIAMGSTWTKNGQYYDYSQAVSPGGETPVLIEHCSEVEGRAPEGYHLFVEIIASAVQADPDKSDLRN